MLLLHSSDVTSASWTLWLQASQLLVHFFLMLETKQKQSKALQWRHNALDSVSNHQPHDCLLNRLFKRRSKKTSKLRVTGLCAGNSTETGEFPAQSASNAENVSIWWRHHGSTMHYWPLRWETTGHRFPSERDRNAENISMPWLQIARPNDVD